MTEQIASPQDEPQERQPTPEEARQVQEVGEAGVAAATKGEDPGKAMKAARDKNGAPLSDAQLEELADKVFGRFETLLRDSGALDPPAEPVKAPEPEPAPPAPGETVPTATPEPAAPHVNRPSWAARFMGE